MAQVVYAASGSLAVEANTRQWIVPPRRCLIVLPNVTHALEAIGETALRTLYLRPDHAERLTHPMGVFDVSPLVTELILETVRLGMLSETSDEQSAMATLLLAGLIKAPLLPLDLLMPTDIRARRVATKISRTLDLSSTVSELSKGTGASERTIERLFQAETGFRLVAGDNKHAFITPCVGSPSIVTCRMSQTNVAMKVSVPSSPCSNSRSE